VQEAVIELARSAAAEDDVAWLYGVVRTRRSVRAERAPPHTTRKPSSRTAGGVVRGAGPADREAQMAAAALESCLTSSVRSSSRNSGRAHFRAIGRLLECPIATAHRR